LRTIRAVLIAVVLGDDFEFLPTHIDGSQQHSVGIEYRYLGRRLG
jgi:hypothetical protein